MASLDQDSLALLAILAVVALLLVAAERTSIPYPILLVVGGLGLGFIPGIPEFELPPDLVLVAVLPPLLYGAAFFTSLRDLRENARPIGAARRRPRAGTMVVVAVSRTSSSPASAGESPSCSGRSFRRRIPPPRRRSRAPRPAATARRADRRGEPRQRRHGARRVQVRRRRRGERHVLDQRGRGSASSQRRRRDRHRPRRRLRWSGTSGVGSTTRRSRSRSRCSAGTSHTSRAAVGVSGVLAAVTVGIYMGWHTPELTTGRRASRATPYGRSSSSS